MAEAHKSGEADPSLTGGKGLWDTSSGRTTGGELGTEAAPQVPPGPSRSREITRGQLSAPASSRRAQRCSQLEEPKYEALLVFL